MTGSRFTGIEPKLDCPGKQPRLDARRRQACGGQEVLPRPMAMRKWLMLRALQSFAFFHIFPLTLGAYMLIFLREDQGE